MQNICEERGPSKDQLQRQLNIPWSTATQKRIPDTNIRRDGDRQKARSPSRHRIDRRSEVSGEAWQQWIRKVWVVEDVEDLSAQLQPQLFRDFRIFED